MTFSFADFSFQLNLNNTDGVANNKIAPIAITSIDKIINTFMFNNRLDYILNLDFLLSTKKALTVSFVS